MGLLLLWVGGTAGPSTALRSGRDDKGSVALSGGFASGWQELQVPPLRSPDFLRDLRGVGRSMRLSLQKGAHVVLSSAAWQEIRVRSGRDDTSINMH